MGTTAFEKLKGCYNGHGSNTNVRVPNLYTKIVCILPAHGTLSHSKLHGWYLDV